MLVLIWLLLGFLNEALNVGILDGSVLVCGEFLQGIKKDKRQQIWIKV